MTAHPAAYNDALLPVFARHLPAHGPLRILDPFAGTGKIARLSAYRTDLQFYGAELELEWARLTPGMIVANALHLPYPTAAFDVIVTSPAYGNRMADHHNAHDASPRHTYRHTLGRPLHADNSGGLQWGDAYRALHVGAWTEARRVLKPGGALLLNCKDHIRRGVLQPVTRWHVDTLAALGIDRTRLVEHNHVDLAGAL